MLSAGDRIAERYEVEALIGQGGLAEVYRVRHIDLGGVHALKLLTWRRKSLAERLLLEGRIQAQLRHPNVVGVIDVVRHEGRFGLLMEYVDSVALDAFIAEHGAFEVTEALSLFAMVMSGMAAAHDAGVLHRDLKPANILLARQANGWVPKVTDFGIAKVVADDVEASHTTAAGAMMGTPGYMAPEQVVDAADVDERADVFALGVILFELLTGRSPYVGDTGFAEPRSTVDMEAPPLSQSLPDLDPNIVGAVEKALSRDRDQRFESVRAFGEALFAGHPQLAAALSQVQFETALALDSRANTLQRLARNADGSAKVRQTLAPLTQPSVEVEPSPPEATNGRQYLVGALLLLFGLGLAFLAAVAGLATVTIGGPTLATVDEGQVAVPDNEGPPTKASPASAEPVPATVGAPEAAVDASPEPSRPPRPDAPPVDGEAEASVEPDEATTEEPLDEEPPTAAEEGTPTLEDPQDAVAEVQVAEVAPAPQPADPTPDLAGTWSGTANGRPFELRISSASDGILVGQAVFLFGSTQRVTALRGTFDPASRAIRLSADDKSVVFEGSGDASRLSGTYRQSTGKRSFPWDVGR